MDTHDPADRPFVTRPPDRSRLATAAAPARPRPSPPIWLPSRHTPHTPLSRQAAQPTRAVAVPATHCGVTAGPTDARRSIAAAAETGDGARGRGGGAAQGCAGSQPQPRRGWAWPTRALPGVAARRVRPAGGPTSLPLPDAPRTTASSDSEQQPRGVRAAGAAATPRPRPCEHPPHHARARGQPAQAKYPRPPEGTSPAGVVGPLSDGRGGCGTHTHIHTNRRSASSLRTPTGGRVVWSTELSFGHQRARPSAGAGGPPRAVKKIHRCGPGALRVWPWRVCRRVGVLWGGGGWTLQRMKAAALPFASGHDPRHTVSSAPPHPPPPNRTWEWGGWGRGGTEVICPSNPPLVMPSMGRLQAAVLGARRPLIRGRGGGRPTPSYCPPWGRAPSTIQPERAREDP